MMNVACWLHNKAVYNVCAPVPPERGPHRVALERARHTHVVYNRERRKPLTTADNLDYL